MMIVILYDDHHAQHPRTQNPHARTEHRQPGTRQEPTVSRYSADQKAQTRRKILRSAGRTFRAKGYAASGVDAVMRGAGLTHGGFYAHFASKQALFAETVRTVIGDSRRSLEDGMDELAPAEWLETLVERYLSVQHLERMRDGCPLPSLLSEIDRAPKAVKTAFAVAGRERTGAVAERFGSLGSPDPEGDALALWSALAGAMAMARAMPTREDAERVLAATRSRWIDQVRATGRPRRP